MPLVANIPPPPFQSLIDVGPFDLRMYGFLIAVGALLAVRMTVQRFERIGGEPDLAEKAMMLALLFGFLGGRIGYVIPRFLVDGAHGAAYVTRPGDILAIWQGGLAFFGGLTGGALAVYLYMRIKRADFPGIADAVAPALPLAQAIGRWGNYFNQELFGRPTEVAWALRVDPVPATAAQQFPGATTFHPTFLYESIWNALLVVALLTIDRKGWLRRRGSLLWCYLIGYGVGRGWIETLRVDTIERYLGLSRNNWIAIGIVLAGIAGLTWWERRPAAVSNARSASDETLEGDDNPGETPVDKHAADTAPLDENAETDPRAKDRVHETATADDTRPYGHEATSPKTDHNPPLWSDDHEDDTPLSSDNHEDDAPPSGDDHEDPAERADTADPRRETDPRPSDENDATPNRD